VERSLEVDIVVVSYNSSAHLRACVEPLSELPDVRVVVVDNASRDASVETLAGLDLTVLARERNGGFAVGCNEGWRAGSAPYVLFLNPDAALSADSLARLVAVLERDERAGAVVPRIEHSDHSLAYSLRRFPRIRSTFAEALFLHRLLPRASWCSEVVRVEHLYTSSWSPEWASGACLLLRRADLERVGGWDESFFLFGEDVDLCARLRQRGLEVRFEPAAVATHVEGASAPSALTIPLLASARIQYANKHHGRLVAFIYRLGAALNALTHLTFGRGGHAARHAHLRALLVAAGVSDDGSELLAGGAVAPPDGR